MAALTMSFKHGQSLADARAKFVEGITKAQAKFASYIKNVDWNDDRTSARLSGPGFDVTLKVDADNVHADGQVPFFLKLALEKPVRKFLEETFKGRDLG